MLPTSVQQNAPPLQAGLVTDSGMAERTGLEPATSNVTGWRSNQLSYRSMSRSGARKLLGDPRLRNLFFNVLSFFYDAASND